MVRGRCSRLYDVIGEFMNLEAQKYQEVWERDWRRRLTRKIWKSGLAPAEIWFDIVRDGGKSSESASGGGAEHGQRHGEIIDRNR